MCDSLKALMYETQYKDYLPDLKMYESLLEKDIPVIEFGTGTGRITKHLLKKGYKVYGIEKETSYRQCFNQKIASENFQANFSFVSDVTNVLEICNIIYPFNVFFYLDVDEVAEELAKLKSHPWNKVIIETDNIHSVNEDNFKSKTHNHAKYLFNEHFIQNQSYLLIQNEVVCGSKTVLEFEYRLFLHKAEFMLSHFESFSNDIKLYGDFELNPYDENSNKLIAVLKM